MSFGDSFSSGFGLDSIVQSIQSAAGLVSAKKNNAGPVAVPWGYQNSNIQSAFFPFLVIKPDRWDELFPYRLMVVDITNNQIVSGTSGGLVPPQITVRQGTDIAVVDFEKGPSTNSWIFTLPISPNQLTITDQFAISTTPTLRGIIEEHNGVKFKLISASGSVGVWPYRANLTSPPSTPTVLQSLFGGTIEALGSVVQSVNSVINTATGNSAANKPTSIRPEVSVNGPSSTGYWMALQLQQFLEQYAEAKKDPKNASWRLVFDIPKQNQSFIVTPMQYNWQQNAAKPMEYLYSLQFKAWRRIDLDQPSQRAPSTVQPISPGILQRLLSTIALARATCSSSLNLIGAVRSDVETPLTVLRQTALFIKDLMGVGIAAADLPSNIIKDYSSSIAQSVVVLKDSIRSISSDPQVRADVDAIVNALKQIEGLSLSAVTSNPSVVSKNPTPVIANGIPGTPGVTLSGGQSNAGSRGQLGTNASVNLLLGPINDIFNNPQAHLALLSLIPVSSLKLNNAQRKYIVTLTQQASQTTVAQLKQYRSVIQTLSLQLSNSFGTGNSFYSQIYGQPAPTPRIQPVTLDEYAILQTLYDAMQGYDILTATTQVDDNITGLAVSTIPGSTTTTGSGVSSVDYVASLAATSQIPFQTPTSKILAPVPFGKSIEGIAQKYLGDAQRWLEIATLNNLRDPYIDENGFKYPLLSNATGRQITIESDDNLYIGQRIILMSTTQVPSARTVLDIDQLSETSFLITLDGLANIDNFVLADSAYLQAYLPGTVNSQQKIFIPSDVPVTKGANIIAPPSTTSDPLTGLSKVDWLLTETGDIAVNNYGDFRVASGITNIVQALMIKFSTFQGTVLTHPTFGLNVRVGSSVSDVDLQNLYNAVNNMIKQDPRFLQIEQFQIVVNGPTLTLNVAVSMPNQTGVFPISYNLTAAA
jgi:hypothetical protein